MTPMTREEAIADELAPLRETMAKCGATNTVAALDLAIAALGGGEAVAVKPLPAFTYGHCEANKQAGGCPYHNLQCGYPECDRRPLPAPPKGDSHD